MPDFSQLTIASAADLFDALKDEALTTAGDWFRENSAAMSGYLDQLAQATMQTSRALAEGRIGEEQAQMIFADQQAALEQTIEFGHFMTMALAQQLADGIFGIVGWVVQRATGISLFPELMPPA